MLRIFIKRVALSCLFVLPGLVQSAEVKIGSHQHAGMEVTAVYLQPVKMEPHMQGMLDFKKADIHLEADIEALEDNKNGFSKGDWIPYLKVRYELEKISSEGDKKNSKQPPIAGDFIPMVANDGPHYGANVKLHGPGKYRLRYTINPPLKNHFPRHIDKETGVEKWFDAFVLEYELIYAGIGKKGGY